MTAEKSSAAQLTEFLPIVTQRHQGEIKQLVDGRQLWQFLESKQHFADWIIKAIEAGFFERNKDYFTFHKIMNRKLGVRGASKRNEYLLTVSMAKELAMLERNEQGKLARRYFIQCEERLSQLAPNDVIQYRQQWHKDREAVKTPFKRMCNSLEQAREREGKATSRKHYINEAKMLMNVLLGMNVHHWRQAHNIIGDTRNALNIEQLLKLEYLEQADSLLLDMGISDYQQRKSKLAEMLAVKFNQK
ncbi:antA/AntB antirepressor family protein [Mannheimia haemolytica]